MAVLWRPTAIAPRSAGTLLQQVALTTRQRATSQHDGQHVAVIGSGIGRRRVIRFASVPRGDSHLRRTPFTHALLAHLPRAPGVR